MATKADQSAVTAIIVTSAIVATIWIQAKRWDINSKTKILLLVFQFVSNIIKKEPMDMSDIIHKRSKRGRKRKTTESDVDCGKLDRISDDYRRKRERNNIAVRKSRDKGKKIDFCIYNLTLRFVF